MNTTSIGDELELKVFNLVKELIENDEFFVNRKTSKVFWKKGYYSSKRKSDITVDISVESYLPNSDQYSLLTIFECKNLNKNVQIDDIEEFSKKLSQIGEHKTVGFMATRKGYSQSVINFAKDEKIGLLKIKTDNEYEWINYRKEKSRKKDFKNQDNPFIATLNDKVFDNLADLCIHLGLIDAYFHNPKYIRVPFRKYENIQNIIDRMAQYDIYDINCLNIDKLIRFIESKYEVTINFEDIEQDNVLGKLEFEPLKISISKNQSNERLRYTLCHEIGHLILHSKLLSISLIKKVDYHETMLLNINSSNTINKRLEIQANIFASYLLLPKAPFIHSVHQYFSQNNIKKGFLYIDNQFVNYRLLNNLLTKLSIEFQASKEAVRIRLLGLNLLQDERTENVYNFKKLI